MAHFILCGLGKVGERVLLQLRATGADAVVIDTRCDPADPRLHGATLIVGDCRQPEILRQAGLDRADGVLVLTSDDLVNLSAALMIRHLHADVRIVVRMFNQNLIGKLGESARNICALSTSALASPLLALLARTGEALSLYRLENGERHQVAEIVVQPQSPLIGQSLAQLSASHQVHWLGYQRVDQPPALLRDVPLSASVAERDRLIVCGPHERIEPLLAEGENVSLPELLWAGLTKRFLRVFTRVFGAIEMPVKICTGLFFGVILVSMLVFHLGMKNDTLVDAFYRTISLLATGADMRGNDVDPGTWQKAFISGLRLVGTALTAAFTALFTNYLIRANLGGAFEIRRIPESGHFIVCGLGNVGFRVVEELLGQGEQVVVLERSADNPFIPAARRLKAAVIVGNATNAEVLRQAHVATARAVVAATSNDLANIEIGFQVREMAPRQRVVLRLLDAGLAQTLRRAANVRLAVSIPELAAPAFVAALHGDQVRSVLQVEGRILAVCELHVLDQDYDRTLRETPLGRLAETYRFVPVSLLAPDRKPRTLTTDEPLKLGERLTLVIAFEDLQPLLRR
jgi:Trk K+ transport system NAD-binding subunit